ncbi:unnamed protein product [Protopolystoma xenopodis]|uniref:Uncharacterized protein n=1 Tax=Protopolystoma xenopodis TaxID=117903 RepID=A0A448X8E0_9PLAT|nr:unnamed protein product [Protopolystoma xenopodis]
MSLVPDDFSIPIGIDGINCSKFTNSVGKRILALGTCAGKKRWHISVNSLDFFPSQENLILSVSRVGGVKIHNVETGSRIWHVPVAHDEHELTSALILNEFCWVTGDENGNIKMWDKRRDSAVGSAFTISLRSAIENDLSKLLIKNSERLREQLNDGGWLSINDMAIVPSNNKPLEGILFAAIDDGTLATVDLNRRCVKMFSDTLGYSARTVVPIKVKEIIN